MKSAEDMAEYHSPRRRSKCEELGSLTRNCANKVLKWSYSLYVRSPINFSTLTGCRYPGIPHLKGNLVTGRLSKFFEKEGAWNNFTEAGERAIAHSSGMCYYWTLTKFILVITKPEDIKSLLVTHAKQVTRTSFKGFEAQFGSSILSDTLETWKKKKAVYHHFLYSQQQLNGYEGIMNDNVSELLSSIRKSDSQPINFTEILANFVINNLASNVIAHATLDNNEIKALQDYLQWVNENVFTFKNNFKMKLPDLIKMLCSRKMFTTNPKIKAQIREELQKILRIESAYALEGFVGSIYGINKSKEDVVGDVNAVFFAGGDTTAAAFLFIVKLLAAHPAIEKKLIRELTAHLSADEITVASLNKLKYLQCVISEALRLYPPVPFLAREVDTAFTLGDAPLNKGDMVLYTPYFTHRSALYVNPKEFNPDHFLKSDIPSGGYIPYGYGALECVGSRFSTQTLKMLIAHIYLRYHINLEKNDFEITLKYGGVVFPKTPLMARFTPRSPLNQADLKDTKEFDETQQIQKSKENESTESSNPKYLLTGFETAKGQYHSSMAVNDQSRTKQRKRAQ